MRIWILDLDLFLDFWILFYALFLLSKRSDIENKKKRSRGRFTPPTPYVSQNQLRTQEFREALVAFAFALATAFAVASSTESPQ